MSLAKQIGLVAAGCQPWHLDVCAACGDRFAYCATLAIYIFQVGIFVGIKMRYLCRYQSGIFQVSIRYLCRYHMTYEWII